MIVDDMIPKIEKTFGFRLYEWQKEYLLGKTDCRMGGRYNGKTFAYCLRLLLSDGQPIPRKEIKLRKLSDNPLCDDNYQKWFVKYLLNMNTILKNAGFQTRIVE